MSEESLDPLQSDNAWNEIASKDADPLDSLVDDFSRIELQGYDERYHVEATVIDEHIYFTDAGGNSITSNYGDWTESSIENNEGEQFGDGGDGPGNKGKGKSNDKDSGSARKGKNSGTKRPKAEEVALAGDK
ncbi:hypothetical protein DL546_006721 [Coniochaeta pulveracea]|uniref:Uncharacterized protein n=1 Tax=Coniochaeta pulveracea TaxID=177199 RepID=A0A420YF86_9PEZI|nr:hypothetical protein DL546_006721 [Coniochaeta pulveracea]